MNDMIPTPEQTPAPQPLAPAKNKGGRPKKNAVATSLAEVIQQMQSLARSETPSGIKQRLLDRLYEFYTTQQQREDAEKNDKAASENRELREQIVALQKENADLRSQPEPEIDFDAMLRSASVVPTTQTPDHSACISKSLHESEISKRDKAIASLEEKIMELTAEIERVKDIAQERLGQLLVGARSWAMNDANAKSILNLEKEYDTLRGRLGRPPVYDTGPTQPTKEQQEYLERQNREMQEWHRRAAELERESVL